MATTDAKSVTLEYSASKFIQYFKQLRALCLRQNNGSLLLSAFSRDPVQHFHTANAQAIASSKEFKKIGKADAKGKFLFFDEENNVIPDALKDNPAATALKFFNMVEQEK